MMRYALRRTLYLFSLISLLTLGTIALDATSAEARKPGVAGESDIKAGNFSAAVSKLEAIEAKNADEYYLLGKAYMGLGQKSDAFKAWTETLHINQGLSKRKKWTFLFPPRKRLKGSQKQRLKEDFEDEYKELKSAIARMKKNQARDLKNKAQRTRIDAKKKDAKEEQLNKMAAAKTKTIDSKQRMADRKAKSNQKRRRTGATRTRTRSGSQMGMYIIGGIVLIILLAVIFGRRSSGGETVVVRSGGGGRRHVQYYDVGYDDHPFRSGPFYYRGRYYDSHDRFHRDHGYYYTNRMYRDGYDRWGSGQHYDEALDAEIHHDIDEREALYNDAAEEGYQADVMRADAEHYEQDAHEIHQEIADADEAAGFFDDGHEFADDEEDFEEEEVYSDYDDGDDHDGGFADDAGYDDGGFEDDGGYDDGGYDDGGYDDGGYDDGGFDDDV